jgi:hypothetical protein
VDAVEQLRKLFTPSQETPDGQPIADGFAPLLKSALPARRRAVSSDINRWRRKTQHTEAIAILNRSWRYSRRLQPYAGFVTPCL